LSRDKREAVEAVCQRIRGILWIAERGIRAREGMGGRQWNVLPRDNRDFRDSREKDKSEKRDKNEPVESVAIYPTGTTAARSLAAIRQFARPTSRVSLMRASHVPRPVSVLHGGQSLAALPYKNASSPARGWRRLGWLWYVEMRGLFPAQFP